MKNSNPYQKLLVIAAALLISFSVFSQSKTFHFKDGGSEFFLTNSTNHMTFHGDSILEMHYRFDGITITPLYFLIDTISKISYTSAPVLEMPSDTVIGWCQTGLTWGAEVTGGILPYTFHWEADGSSPVSIPTDSILTITPTYGMTNYTLTVTDANGFTDAGSFSVYVDSLWLTDISDLTVGFCETDIQLEVNIDGCDSCHVPASDITYTWETHAGLSSHSIENPMFSAAGLPSGLHELPMSIEDKYGCIVMDTAQVTLDTLVIETVFTDTLVSPCNPVELLSTLMVGVDDQVRWYDEGGTEIGTGFTYIISAPTPLSVETYRVVVTDAYGCTDNDTVRVEVSDVLFVSFENLVSPTCYQESDASVEAVATGGVPPYAYEWLGTGQTTAVLSGVAAGDYTLRLTDSEACMAEDLISIPEGLNLSAGIAGTPLSDDSLSWQFAAETLADNLTDLTFSWRFPSGLTLYGDTITRSFLQARELPLCLTLQSTINEACSYSLCDTFLIGRQDVICEALFSFTLDTNMQTVSLVNETDTDRFTHLNWSLGDGALTTENDPTHTYTSPGTYQVCLSVSDSTRGCQATSCKTVVVNQTIPDVIADFDFTVFPNQKAVLLENKSSHQTSSVWRIGNDTNTLAGLDTLYSFGRDGLFRVCLQAQNDVSADRTCKWIEISPLPCDIEADFNFFVDQATGSVSFANTSSGTLHTAYWDFDNGSASSRIQAGTRTFDPGTYTVSLTVRDSLSACMASVSKQVQIATASCQAAFNFVNNTANPATLHFENRSRGNNNRYLWDFGDGRTSREIQPEHTYHRAGTYVVTLRVSDTTSTCQDVVTYVVESGNVPCVADFVHFVDSTSRRVSFQSRSLGDSLQYSWILGDGSVMSGKNPAHQFAEPGTYTVTLFVQEPATGCIATQTKEVLISQLRPVLSRFNYFVDEDGGVRFVNRSMGDATGYLWSFGDDSEVLSTMEDTLQRQFEDGRYTVCLTALSTGEYSHIRCHTFEVEVEEKHRCNAAFVRMVDGQHGRFQNFSEMDEGTTFTWYIDGEEEGFDMDWDYTFPDTGFYRISLEIETSKGCRDAAHQLVVASAGRGQGMKANFAHKELPAQLKVSGYPVDFVGIAHGDAAKIRWEFGDDAVDSTNINPTHYYQEPGVYTACFTVEDPITGLSDRYCEEIRVGLENSIENLQDKEAPATLSVYPNPALEQITIAVQASEELSAHLYVVDSRGQVIEILQTSQLKKGTHEIPLSVAHYATGKYYLVMQQDHSKIVTSFVKE